MSARRLFANAIDVFGAHYWFPIDSVPNEERRSVQGAQEPVLCIEDVIDAR